MSRDHELTEAKFLKDVSGHRMEILRDDGIERRIRFKRPETQNMSFDLTTWPGYLAYTGDMGCYVFTRLPDMFEFFRTDRTHGELDGRKLYINLGYWGEKVVAADRDGIKVYSPDVFRDHIKSWLDGQDADRALRKAVTEDVLCHADDGEHEAMRAAIDYQYEGNLVFQDFWEADCRTYTFRFRWCCYALAWGIQQYDDAKVPA